MRFEEAYGGWQSRRLTQEEAARLLGVCERTFRRYVDRYEDEGLDGLLDKRLAQVSARRAPVDEVVRTETLYRERYEGWNVRHFYRFYRREHQGTRSYTWVKNTLQGAGLVAKAAGRGKHRRRRESAPVAGMMLHQDGSTHECGHGRPWRQARARSRPAAEDRLPATPLPLGAAHRFGMRGPSHTARLLLHRRRIALAEAGLGDEVDVGIAEVVLPRQPRLVVDFRPDVVVAAPGQLPVVVVVDDVHVHDGGIVLEVEPLPDVDSDNVDVAELALEGGLGDLTHLLLVHLETSCGCRSLNST